MNPRGKILKNIGPKSVFCVRKQDGLYTGIEVQQNFCSSTFAASRGERPQFAGFSRGRTATLKTAFYASYFANSRTWFMVTLE